MPRAAKLRSNPTPKRETGDPAARFPAHWQSIWGPDASIPAPASPVAAEAPIKPERDFRKQSVYMPAKMLEQIRQEAQRLDRSVSWLVQRAWATAYPELSALPAHGVDGTPNYDFRPT